MLKKDFLSVYRSIINESANKKEQKSEAEMDYDDILEAVLDQMNWREQKKKAVRDLLYPYKYQKYKLEAIKVKMQELRANSRFFEECLPIMEDFQKLNLDWDRYMSIQQGFNKMIDNPNYQNRRNFMKRMTNWLDKETPKTIVALADVEARLRKLVKKYACPEEK